MIEYFELLFNSIIPLSDLIFQHKICHEALAMIRESKHKNRTYFSKTTPNTSSTSPASPRPVIRAKQFPADRRCSAASTMSLSMPHFDNRASEMKSLRCWEQVERSCR